MSRENNVISDTNKIIHKNFSPSPSSKGQYIQNLKKGHKLYPIFEEGQVFYDIDLEEQEEMQREQNQINLQENSRSPKDMAETTSLEDLN